MIPNGQHKVQAMSLQLTNLSGGSSSAVAFVSDDGNHPADSGTGGNTHTFDALSSTGPDTIVKVTWTDGSTHVLNTLTFNGNSCVIIIQNTKGSGEHVGAAICAIRGAQSGDIVATFDGNVNDSHLTILSFSSINSFTALDTDTLQGNGTNYSFTGLTISLSRGCSLVAAASGDNNTSFIWVNAIEVSDVRAGAFSHTHTAAYALGTLAGTIVGTAADSNDRVGAAVSLR